MTIAIIPDGPTQFFHLELDLSKQSRIETIFVETQFRATQDVSDWHLTCVSQEDNNWVDKATGRVLADDGGSNSFDAGNQYSVSLNQVIQQFRDKWVPLPYLRLAGTTNAFDKRFWPNAPTDWCRLYLSEVADKQYKVILAFDPRVQHGPTKHDVSPEDGYPTLTDYDVDEAGQFALATHPKDMAWFLELSWVKDWLKSFNTGRRTDNVGSRTEHIARYVALLELLEKSEKFPTVRLINPKIHKPVDVDLVLDIGNCRSIGMLIERRVGESSDLSDGAKLEIRNLSQPTEIFQGTFSSTLCFSEARLGDPEGHSRASGRDLMAFNWPTLARVGTEAIGLASASKRDMGPTSMSSPKRYLWDLKPRNSGEEWRFSAGLSGREDPVNRGRFAAFINDCGVPLNQLKAPSLRIHSSQQELPVYPVTTPKFSRSSLMMFLLAEVFQHALVQINSPHKRKERLNPDLPRRLRQVILTVPPAMTVSERNLYEFWAKSAVDTLWKANGWDPARQEFQAKPKIQVKLDEASATQLVFIYNEIAVKFPGDSEGYFSTFGKSSHSASDPLSVRVASIDIGGGTTDMVITTYVNQSENVTNIISPRQEFRESFNFAGDDIVKLLIEKHILPEIISKLELLGCQSAQDQLISRFGRNTVGLTQNEKNLRAQFTQQVLQPIAFALLTEIEKMEGWDRDRSITLDTASVFKDVVVTENVISFLSSLVPASKEWVISATTLDFDLSAIERTIAGAVSPYLNDLMEVVNQFDCDFLLISGRPSCLPVIQSIFFANPPLPPHRIIPMNKYKIGKWYPFLDLHGNIGDPKTTGVVGALLSAVSEGNMLNFHFRSKELRPASTINYLGPMNLNRQILTENLFFEGVNLENDRQDDMSQVFKFASPVYIGFRQLSVERWKTTPVFYLSFSTQEAAARAVQLGLPYTVQLNYRRPGASETDGDANFHNEGIMEIVEITSSTGQSVPARDLSLTFKTLWDVEGHWLDTGLFDL
jgi:hypothetical protein